MTSKEALGRLLMLARPCAYEVREHRNSYCDMLENVIKQDLDRLEQLEKELKDGTLSDGYHTFNDLYFQRMYLFATIVNQNKQLAWKSLKHEDGELCFGGGWFIVGIDTPNGSYTYHYETNYWSLFNCQELEVAKHWDGHTSKDVDRLLSLHHDAFDQLEKEKVFRHLQSVQELEKEIQELRKAVKSWNENCGKLIRENTKLKKALRVLKDRFEIESIYKDDTCYAIDCANTYYILTKEEYELLKEMLEEE